jgi:uncharacterized cupredoxin-like copper-binding protein
VEQTTLPFSPGHWNRLRRPLGAAAIALVGASLVGSAFIASAQTQTPAAATTTPPLCGTPAASGDPCVGVGMFDIYFDPNLATIPSDKAVEVSLKNNGATVHNFSVTDHGNAGLKNLNISVTINPGESGTASINAPAGEYYFFCDQPGHEAAGMRGYITVKSDASITTAAATVTPRPE